MNLLLLRFLNFIELHREDADAPKWLIKEWEKEYKEEIRELDKERKRLVG